MNVFLSYLLDDVTFGISREKTFKGYQAPAITVLAV